MLTFNNIGGTFVFLGCGLSLGVLCSIVLFVIRKLNRFLRWNKSSSIWVKLNSKELNLSDKLNQTWPNFPPPLSPPKSPPISWSLHQSSHWIHLWNPMFKCHNVLNVILSVTTILISEFVYLGSRMLRATWAQYLDIGIPFFAQFLNYLSWFNIHMCIYFIMFV